MRTGACIPFRILLAALAVAAGGCGSMRQAEAPVGPHFRILTYNVNWGGPRPDLAVELIRESGADIVCLQETTPAWERYVRQTLANEYSFAEFRSSKGRMGGGLGFLSKRCRWRRSFWRGSAILL